MLSGPTVEELVIWEQLHQMAWDLFVTKRCPSVSRLNTFSFIHDGVDGGIICRHDFFVAAVRSAVQSTFRAAIPNVCMILSLTASCSFPEPALRMTFDRPFPPASLGESDLAEPTVLTKLGAARSRHTTTPQGLRF